jgi:hypothetical protein
MVEIHNSFKFSILIITIALSIFCICYGINNLKNSNGDNSSNLDPTHYPSPINTQEAVSIPNISNVTYCDKLEMNKSGGICTCPSDMQPNYDNYFKQYDGDGSELELKIYNNYSYPIYCLIATSGGYYTYKTVNKFIIQPKKVYKLKTGQIQKSRLYVFLTKPGAKWDKEKVGSSTLLGEDDGASLIEMDASSGHWDYDISLVDYTTIPIYMLARGKDGNRLNTDLNCDAAMIYSGAGADCTNKMMVKDCPTKHITKNCMEMCQSPILLCKDFGGNQSLPPFCNDLDDAIKQFNTKNVQFDQDFINNKLGLQYDTPQSFIYGGLQAVANSSGIKDLVKDKNPAIYKTILTGINTGRCSLDDIKNSECNPITRDSCMSNGTKGNVFPILLKNITLKDQLLQKVLLIQVYAVVVTVEYLMITMVTIVVVNLCMIGRI